LWWQAKSLTWNFVDDVELAIDVDKREVRAFSCFHFFPSSLLTFTLVW